MKSTEFITEWEDKQKGGKRIPTGVANQTVLDPSTFTGGAYNQGVKIVDKYSGDPMGIDLGNVQERNFDALSAILKRSKKKFKYIGYVKYEGDLDYIRRRDASNKGKTAGLTRFVATAPGFVWEKYEGAVAGGGRNTVYVGGEMMKLTSFLKLNPKHQDALVRGDKGSIDKEYMKNLDPRIKKIDIKKFYMRWRDLLSQAKNNKLKKLMGVPKKQWGIKDWQALEKITASGELIDKRLMEK